MYVQKVSEIKTNKKTNEIENLKKKKKNVTFSAALWKLMSQSVRDWFFSDSSVGSWQETLWDFVAELCKTHTFTFFLLGYR